MVALVENKSLPRLLVHVEGQTEETFVNEVLAPYLYQCGYQKVSARLVGNARQRNRRGGIRGWNTVRRDIVNHLKEDPGCIATTMVDYYALPSTGDKAWPGREQALSLPFAQKASVVQDAIFRDVQAAMGPDFIPTRFIPYVIMHEFEALLFSDCARFAQAVGHAHLIPELQAIRSQFNTPEEINDSYITAPSKRVESLIPGYEKPLLGNLAAIEIGLATIRSQCPFFSDWLDRLRL